MAASASPPPPTTTTPPYRVILKRRDLDLRNRYLRTSMPNFCEFLSQLTPDQISENDWLNFIPNIKKCLDDGILRPSALLALDNMVRGGAHARFQPVSSWIVPLKSILEESRELEVKGAALKASFGFMLLYPENPDRGPELQDLLSHVMNSMYFQDGIKSEEDQEWFARAVLEELLGLARVKLYFLRKQIRKVICFAFQIMENPLYGEKTRFLGLEFVVTLADERATPGHSVLLGGESEYVGRMLSQLLTMLESIDADNHIFEEKNAMFDYAIDQLTRFSTLGATYLLETFPQIFESRFCSTEWKSRFAAVTCLSVLAIRNSEELKRNLDLVAKPALNATNDDHPLVRWAAINAITKFSRLLGPEFPRQYHGKVLPILTKAMQDFQNTVIRVLAMNYYGENCTSDVLMPYMDQIVSQLLKCLQDGNEEILGEALMLLASMFTSSKTHMQEHYGAVMPYLKVIKRKATADQNHTLLAESINGISSAWMAVGKETVVNDIDLVVDTLISSDGSKLEWGHPMRFRVLQTWGRLCKCLGQNFRCYMRVAIPRLLQSARLEEPVSLDMSITIRDSVLEEKALACDVLCSCVAELQDGFDVWIHKVAETLVPHLGSEFHEVAIACISGMPAVLRSYKAAVDREQFGRPPFERMCSDIASTLLEALDKELLTEISPLMFGLLEQCMEMSGGPILNADQIRQFLDVTVILKAISGSEEKSNQGKKISEQFEQSLITVMKTHMAFSSQIFDQLQSWLSETWDIDKALIIEQKIAWRMFNGITKQFREEAIKYFESSLPLLFEACSKENPEVRQVAAQTIGFCAEFGGSTFVRHVKEALDGLSVILKGNNMAHEALTEDLDDFTRGNCMAHDAAVSAFGKICLFHLDNINAAEDLNLLFSHLPIKNNLDEAKVAHDLFCSLVSKLNERSVGQDEASLCKIIAVFSEILRSQECLATKETVERVIGHLKDMKTQSPSVLSSLQPSMQNLLEQYLSS